MPTYRIDNQSFNLKNPSPEEIHRCLAKVNRTPEQRLKDMIREKREQGPKPRPTRLEKQKEKAEKKKDNAVKEGDKAEKEGYNAEKEGDKAEKEGDKAVNVINGPIETPKIKIQDYAIPKGLRSRFNRRRIHPSPQNANKNVTNTNFMVSDDNTANNLAT